MKKILLPGFIMATMFAHAQVDVFASAGTSTATYTTLKDAFDKINDETHKGYIVINITGNTTETATAVLNAGFTYSAVMIKPTTTATISGAISGATTALPLIKILGSNVTIDGSATQNGTTRDLTFNNTATSNGSVLYLGSPLPGDSMHNVTVKNSVLFNGNTSSSNIVLADGSTTAGYFSDITIQNNEVKQGYNGIFVLANNTVTGNGNNLLIKGNTIGNNVLQNGVFIAGVDGVSEVSNNTVNTAQSFAGSGSIAINIATGTNKSSIFSNTITSKHTASSGTTNYATGIAIAPGITNISTKVYNNIISEISGYLTYLNSSAIYLSGATPNVSIYNNKISGIINNKAAGNIFGIVLASISTTSNITAYNNVISDIKTTGAGNAFGLYLQAGGGYKLYNNTLNLNTSNSETALSAALFVSSNITTANTLDIRNNIFSNTKTASPVSIYSSASKTVFGSMDNNVYVGSAALGYIGGTVYSDISGMQTGFGGNTNSFATAPVFVSATDMHLLASNNPGLDNMGTPVGVTADKDNIKRRTTPDIGAYEFGLPECVIGITPANGATSVAFDPTNISWTSAGGANAYKLYLGTTPGGTDVLNGTTLTNTSYTANLNANTQYYLSVTASNGEGTASGCQSVTFKTSTTMAVSDLSKAGISVYPNPFADVLKISDVKGIKSISVNDMSGREVKTLAPATELNLSNLKQGLYIVNLKMEDGSIKTFKAIKK